MAIITIYGYGHEPARIGNLPRHNAERHDYRGGPYPAHFAAGRQHSPATRRGPARHELFAASRDAFIRRPSDHALPRGRSLFESWVPSSVLPTTSSRSTGLISVAATPRSPMPSYADAVNRFRLHRPNVRVLIDDTQYAADRRSRRFTSDPPCLIFTHSQNPP